jgi:hypothetical protein
MKAIQEQLFAGDGDKSNTATYAAAPSAPAKKVLKFKKKGITAKTGAPAPGLLTAPEPQPDQDEFEDLVCKIENLKEAEARGRVGELEDASHKTYFELGGVLSRIKNGWFAPHASFDDWVAHETTVRHAKARYLIQIYEAAADCDIAWAKVKDIGWTKMCRIASVLNKENADYWIGKASTLSKGELVKFLREHKAKPEVAEGEQPEVAKSKIFKLYPGQAEVVSLAIEKVKKDTGQDHDNMALENICHDFLGGQTLEQKLVQLGPKKIASIFTNVLNSLQIDAAEEVMRMVCEGVAHDFAFVVD